MMIASQAGLACAEATVGRRAGSTLGHRVVSRPRAPFPLVDREVEVVWKLRLGPIISPLGLLVFNSGCSASANEQAWDAVRCCHEWSWPSRERTRALV